MVDRAALTLVHVHSEAASWHFARGQCRYMTERGLTVYGISSSDGGALEAFGDEEGIETQAVEITRTIRPLRDLVAVLRLRARLRAIRPQIVEGHTSKAGLIAMIAAWLVRVPVRIYHNHGMMLSAATGLRKRILWVAERVTCALATRVLYVAPSVRDDALRLGVCPPSKTEVILSINGLDAKMIFAPAAVGPDARERTRRRYGIPDDALVLGFVGRLFRVKGVAELVAAWDRLSREHSNLHLLAVGAYDEKEPLQPGVVRQLQADPRIHLTGFLPDVAAVYPAMDVLVLPSFHEGLGYVLIEAAALAVPVIGTSIPGILDAIEDGVTGIIIPPGDVDAIVEASSRYLLDPEMRLRHGVAGRQRVLRLFEPESVWAAQLSLYRRLLGEKGFALPNVEDTSARRDDPEVESSLGD